MARHGHWPPELRKLTQLTLPIYFLHTADDPETASAYEWLRATKPRAQRIAAQEIPASGENKILWWHATDRRQIENNQQHLPVLDRFCKSGGRVFLSLAAVLAVVRLGVEDQEPDICEDGYYSGKTGEFEVCGLMGFLRHPIFARVGFRGGSGSGLYLWKPPAGARYWRFGYGKHRWPRGTNPAHSGMVFGVHRFHIGFDSNQKFAWEYDVPRAVCVGAYLYFADPMNPYREHVRAFAAACLDYLSAPPPKKRYHWQETIAAVTPVNQRPALVSRAAGLQKRRSSFSSSATAQRIKWVATSPKLETSAESNNFFDLAGERLLLMGNERGPIAEVWSHPLRLCRDLSVEMRAANQAAGSRQNVWHNGANTRVTIRPHHIERCNAEVVEHVWVSADQPLACIDWYFTKGTDLEIEISFTVDFRLMWPYPAGCLSELKYAILQQRQCILFTDQRRLFLAQFSISRAGEEPEVTDLSNEHHSCARVVFRRRLNSRAQKALQFIMIGGAANEPGVRKLCRDFPLRLRQLFAAQAKQQIRLIEQYAEVDTPEPDFNEAARWAKLKAAAFVCRVPSLGKSLLAGFATTGEGCPDWSGGRPGYAWFFGRDACWTAFAMLHYGDFENVREILRFLGRHQDLTGKILHELTTSGAVHYDAADSTPLYAILMARYLDHTGDTRFVRSQWPHLLRAMNSLFSSDRDGDGLIENSGVGHGWIEGGRLHGVHVEHYLAGCWAEALRGAAHCAEILGKRVEAEKWSAHHQRVKQMLAADFWNETAGYFYHGKRKDGTYDPQITALAAVPLLFGYGSDEQAHATLDRLAGKNFNADWGVRIVNDEDPLYAPHGYHYGSVWPLFTGWAALAAFKRGRPVTAMTQLRNSMRNFRDGALGCMEEVLHGEIYEPAGICAHQAWSEAMILQSIFEGLLGFAPCAWKRLVSLEPRLPLAWTFFCASPLHVGTQQLTFSMERDGSELTFSFSHKGRKLHLSFAPHFPACTQIGSFWAEGQKQASVIQEKGDERVVAFSTNLTRDTLRLAYRITKCWSAIAPAAEAYPGERSRGYLIVRESLIPSGVRVVVEGEAGARHRLQFVCWGYKMKSVHGGELTATDGERGVIDFAFDDARAKYVRKAIAVDLD